MDNISKYVQEGYQKFQKAVFALSKSISDKRISENQHEWFLVTKNILLNEKGARKISKTPTTEEKIASKITQGFFEIVLSYDSMTEIPLYLSRYPQKLAYKSKYLVFVITNYFNEVYILSKRIDAYTKRITRLYKDSPHIAKLSKTILTIDKDLTNFFKNDNNIRRGRHVHEERYQDEDLNRLVYLEVLHGNTSISADKLITLEYKKALVTNKKKWLDFFEKSNKKYEIVLGSYFTVIYPIIFDNNGNFIKPK